MKILTNKRMNEINLYTTRLHEIANKKELSIDDRGVLLANIDAIRSVCKLPYIRRFINFAPIPFEIKPPKKDQCEHLFDIGFYANSTPFLFCKHCAKIVDFPIDKKQEDKQ